MLPSALPEMSRRALGAPRPWRRLSDSGGSGSLHRWKEGDVGLARGQKARVAYNGVACCVGTLPGPGPALPRAEGSPCVRCLSWGQEETGEHGREGRRCLWVNEGSH